jgi:hypothetical protein
MPGGATGDDPDAPDRRELLRRQPDVRQIRFAVFERVAATHRIQNRLRLFVNLLEHEMRIAAFFGRRRVPGDA